MTPQQRTHFTAEMNAIHVSAHNAAAALHAAIADAAAVYATHRATFAQSMKALENRMVQANTAHASAKETVRALAKEKREELSGSFDEKLAAHNKEWAEIQAQNDGSPAWEQRATDCLTRFVNMSAL